MSTYSFEMGLSLTFTLLDELKQAAPQVLEKAMHNIYAAMIKLKTGLLSPDDYKFYAREQILNRHRDYLVNIIKDENASQVSKDLAIRLVIIIGNLRSSGEDYLVAYNLIKMMNLTINLDSELSLNKYFQSEESQEGSKETFKIDNKGSREVELMTGIGTDPTKYNQTLFTFDEKYAFVYNSYAGLFKYGLKNTPTTKAGLNYASNTSNNYNLKCILCLKNKLYVRNHDDTDKPFAMYDIRSLEEKDEEEFGKKLVKCSRKEDQPWNEKILERTNLNTLEEMTQRNELDFYRRMVRTPLFSDGDSLFVISIYITNPSQGSSESECEVEIYDPETWACIGYKRLIMEPEEQKEWTNEQSTKIAEQTDHIKQYLDADHLHEHVFATNGEQLAVNIQEKMYFFDLKTGKRLAE